MGKIKELAHSKWKCKYHIVFAPKYHRKEMGSRTKIGISSVEDAWIAAHANGCSAISKHISGRKSACSLSHFH